MNEATQQLEQVKDGITAVRIAEVAIDMMSTDLDLGDERRHYDEFGDEEGALMVQTIDKYGTLIKEIANPELIYGILSGYILRRSRGEVSQSNVVFAPEIDGLLERIEKQILLTPTGEARNVLTDARIVIETLRQ